MTTATKIGTGEFTYEVAVGWESLPPGYTWQEAAAVAVSPKDEVYVFNRSDHPVIVFDTNGRYLRDWGDPAVYPRAHGITFSPDGTLFLIDDDNHTVRKCTPEGKVIFTLGTPGAASRSTAQLTLR
jgi:DNA-binding beta-propeller fold protein YncE